MTYKEYCNDKTIFQMASEVSMMCLCAYGLKAPLGEVLKWSWSIGFVRELFLTRDPNAVRTLAEELKKNLLRHFVLHFRGNLFNPYIEVED